MRVVEQIEAALRTDGQISIDQIGGPTAVIDEAEDIAASPVFDEVVRVIAREWETRASTAEASALAQMVSDGLAKNTRPVCIADAMDALLDYPVFARTIGKRAAAALIARADTDRHTHPLAAAYALEGALRMALEEHVSRHLVLAAFDDLSGNEPELFVTKVVRLLGVARDAWRYDETGTTLQRLLGVSGSEDEVAFELGMTSLSRALDASDADAVVQHLTDARQWFARAERAAAGRLDAVAYGAAVDAVLNFGSIRSQPEIDGALRRLNNALADERWVFGKNAPTWLRPRATATRAWGALALELTDIAVNVQRHSWFDAARVLERVLDTYRCSRRVRRAGELAPIVQPMIEAAFVARQGLLTHLDDFLAQGADSTIDTETAERLRARVRARAAEPSPGKAPGMDAGKPQRSSLAPTR